ncbi:MAG: ACT domain-containing protein [Anaerolineales bacterium]|nr:ACT domain-containing protein [Anaerolineales bacterium]
MKLSQLQGEYAICKLNPRSDPPEWAFDGEFYSVSRTADELSIICLYEQIPEQIPSQPGWRALKIEGPFDFDEIGVLASMTAPLAEAGISLLTISTFDTDYIFLQSENYQQAIQFLAAAGHKIN